MKDNPFDGPSIEIGSDKFKEMIMQLMINKHNDADEDFDLNA
tara:strand:- start:4818 stop:4943 length:126 start_codon:yes stop_codon:yes gene_type:complete